MKQESPGTEKYEDDLADELHAAISEVYRRHEALVNRWMLTCETLNGDGSKTVGYMTSPDMQLWEVLGMNAAQGEYAKTQLSMDYIEGTIEDTEFAEDEDD